MPTKEQLIAKCDKLENKLDEIRELVCGDHFEESVKAMDAREEIEVYNTFSRITYKSSTPTFNLSVYVKYGDEDSILTRSYSIDDFLAASEDLYGCSDDGWGHLFIEDLEKLKTGIQKRIDAMKKAIETETYEQP
jgi:hypothetical protein